MLGFNSILQTKKRLTGSSKAALPVAIALAIAPLLVAGCGSHSQDAATSSGVGTQPSASTTSMRGSDVVATVNGDSITSGELYDALQHFIPAHVPSFPNNPDLNEPAGQSALKNLIVGAVTVQFAKTSGVPVTADQLNQYYNDQLMVQEAKVPMPFEQVLQYQGYTADSYKQEVLAPQVAQFNVLQKAENIAPGDLQAQYNTTQSQYVIPARVHVHRIACATKQDAENVYSGIKGGRQMADFAGVNLAGGEGGNPSDSTDFSRWLDPGLIKSLGTGAASELLKAKTGDLLEPVSVQRQWWVMQVVDTKPSQPLPFNQVSDLVRVNLIRSRAGAAGQSVQQQIFQAVNSAVIKINQPEYQSVAMQVHMLGAAGPTQPQPSAPVKNK